MECQPWIRNEGCCPEDVVSEVPAATAEHLWGAAANWVYQTIGRKYPGICSDTIDICIPCRCEIFCHKCPPKRFFVPRTRWSWPLISASIDSSPLPVVDDRIVLPSCGEYTITITYGENPPADIIYAASKLWCELMKQCAGKPCDLPDNATAITDNGVTIRLAPPKPGFSGISEVDMILEAHKVQYAEPVLALDPENDVVF